MPKDSCPIIHQPRRLSISEMAELNQITPETLRHYDRIGLLKPAYRDPVTGYRSYLLTQSAQLDMIQFLKELGFDLPFIKQQFEAPDYEALIRLFGVQEGEIDRQIEHLRRRKRILRRCVENYSRVSNAPTEGTPVLEYLPARDIYVIDTGVNFYEHDREIYEGLLRRVKEEILRDSLPDLSFFNVGTIWRKEAFDRRDFCSTELFVFVDPADAPRVATEKLPAGFYLCLYCSCFEHETSSAETLIRELDRLGYKSCGDYVCEVLSDFPILSEQERAMNFRIQVPVALH